MSVRAGAGTGALALEMRRAMGIAVFTGRIGVTFFGLLLMPVFFTALQRRKAAAQPTTAAALASEPAQS